MMKCIKCGSENIVTTYQKKLDSPLYQPCELDNYGEHLHRHCRNCHYEWCDPTLDRDGK